MASLQSALKGEEAGNLPASSPFRALAKPYLAYVTWFTASITLFLLGRAASISVGA